MARAKPQLIHETVSSETIVCAKSLVTGAQDGRIVGAVIGYLYRGQRYSVSVCGLAYENPTWARGVACAIDDELERLIHERGLSDTTI